MFHPMTFSENKRLSVTPLLSASATSTSSEASEKARRPRPVRAPRYQYHQFPCTPLSVSDRAMALFKAVVTVGSKVFSGPPRQQDQSLEGFAELGECV
ncbi:hypothetical protein M0R45_036775 [Rubus argutus]|uniref:Uncharacterized protein n=1 Tax=Rubus argutus TaxID=59490 RepID=A0AAW1VX77_RUBAR